MRMASVVTSWLTAVVAINACAAATGEIRGLVRDADGAPAVGAGVVIMQVPRDSVGGSIEVVRTDRCGRYRAPRLRAGRYLVDASGKGDSADDADTIVVTAGRRTTADLIATDTKPAHNSDRTQVRGC